MAARLNRRLLTELRDYTNADDDPNVLYLAPISDANLLEWDAIIAGPSTSPFEGMHLDLSIRVHPLYPSQPPVIRFKPSTVFHPNISFETGEICLDVLQNEWTPSWNLASACLAVQALLGTPEPSSPLNVDAANLLRCADSVGYASMVYLFR